MLFTGYSRRTLLAFFLALLVHLMLLVILMVSLGWSSKSRLAKQEATPVVQATVVDEDKLLAEAEQQQVGQETLEAKPDLAEIERRQQAAAEQTRQEAERQRELEKQERLKQLEVERQAKEEEARRQAEAERKRAEEEKRQAEAEKQRLEEEARRQAEAERKRAEEERRRLEEERRRAEAARKAEEERRQQELQARIRAEQNAARERQIKADIGRFITQVELRVKRHWIRPPSTRDNVAVLLQVEMLPSGEVRNVEVIQSSGDRALDRSAQAAVYKAAPLPVPPDPAAAARLLPRFNFRFITR